MEIKVKLKQTAGISGINEVCQLLESFARMYPDVIEGIETDLCNLVLNLDDEIDWKYLTDWHNVVHPDYRKLKVSDIAVPLVNAILKAKNDDSKPQKN